MSKCDIYLENYSNCYYAGQQIIGYLQCTFTEEKSIKGIVVRFKGSANTKWSESESYYNSTTKKNETKTVWYHGTEDYFSSEINLLNNHGEDTVIPAGMHKYPFIFTLPGLLPSSFEGSNGDITYSVKGIVKRPLLKFDYEAKSPFNLVSLIDLNADVSLRANSDIRKQRNLCCFCWKNGPITFELSIPCTGYAVGQNIDIYLFIENMSNSSVSEVKFKVEQRLEFITHVPRYNTRSNTDVITQKKISGVGAHGSRTYEEPLTIPAGFSAPNLNACSLINITYCLEVVAYLPCPHKNITARIPIVIGHIPINGMSATQRHELPTYDSVVEMAPAAPPMESYEFPSAPPATGSTIGWTTDISNAPMPAPPYMPEMKNDINDVNLPPPTYEQATTNFKKQ